MCKRPQNVANCNTPPIYIVWVSLSYGQKIALISAEFRPRGAHFCLKLKSPQRLRNRISLLFLREEVSASRVDVMGNASNHSHRFIESIIIKKQSDAAFTSSRNWGHLRGVASNYSYLERSSLFPTNTSRRVGSSRPRRAGAAVQMENGQRLPFAELNHGLIWSVRSGREGGEGSREIENVPKLNCHLSCLLACLLAARFCAVEEKLFSKCPFACPSQSAKIPSFTKADRERRGNKGRFFLLTSPASVIKRRPPPPTRR